MPATWTWATVRSRTKFPAGRSKKRKVTDGRLGALRCYISSVPRASNFIAFGELADVIARAEGERLDGQSRLAPPRRDETLLYLVPPELLRAGRFHDFVGPVLQELGRRQIIRVVLIGDPDGGNAPCVLYCRVQAHAVGFERQRGAMPGGHRGPRECLQPRLELRTPGRQVAARGQRPDTGLGVDAGVDAAAAIEPALRIGIVEVVEDARNLDALVIIDLVFEDGM